MWVYRNLCDMHPERPQRACLMERLGPVVFTVLAEVANIAWLSEDMIIEDCGHPSRITSHLSDAAIVYILLRLMRDRKIERRFVPTPIEPDEVVVTPPVGWFCFDI